MNASKFRVVRTRVLSLLGSSYGFILSLSIPTVLLPVLNPTHPLPTLQRDYRWRVTAKKEHERTYFHFVYIYRDSSACLFGPPSLPPSLGHRGDIHSSPIYYSLDYLSGGRIGGHVIVIVIVIVVMRTLAGTMLQTGYRKPC